MHIELTDDERTELLRVLDNVFRDTRVEIRHTQNREYREQLQREEAVLRGLLDKLNRGETIMR